MKFQFKNREKFRQFIKGCKLIVEEKDSNDDCPFGAYDDEDCLIFCGQLFPEHKDLILDTSYCPCDLIYSVDTSLLNIFKQDIFQFRKTLVIEYIEKRLDVAKGQYRRLYL